MNTTDPTSAVVDLESITQRLADAVAEEERLIVEVAVQERATESALADAYLAGKSLPATKALDTARRRLIAVRAAIGRLRTDRDRTEAAGIAARVDGALAEVREIHAKRTEAYRAALALTVLAARAMAHVSGQAGGGYPVSGRLADCGLLSAADLPHCRYMDRLRQLDGELSRLGMTATGEITKASHHDIPGGPQLRGRPLVAETRALVDRMERTLADLLPSDLPRFIVDPQAMPSDAGHAPAPKAMLDVVEVAS